MNKRLFFNLFILLHLLYIGCFQSPLCAQQNAQDMDSAFTMGAFNNDVIGAVVQADDKIIVFGKFTAFRSIAANGLIRLNADGSIDNSFSIGSGANGYISAVSLQSDGKIIIGGTFTQYNGTNINYLARLYADGSFDNSFSTGTGPNNPVYAVAVQADQKILIAGAFSKYNGANKNYIARVNTNGSLDNSFVVTGSPYSSNNKFYLQPDGKIVFAGDFTSFSGRSGITRLNSDGSFDPAFNVGGGTSGGPVNSLAFQPDGKIVIVGTFITFNGTTKRGIVRINADGTTDNSFNIGAGFGVGYHAKSILIHSDGKILLTGPVGYYNNMNYYVSMIRLNSDGSVDTTFPIAEPGSNYPFMMANKAQSNGQAIIITNLGAWNYSLVRFNTSGSIDNSFKVSNGSNSAVVCFHLQKDGKILIGGGFTNMNGNLRNRIARIHPDGRVDDSFSHPLDSNDAITCIKTQDDGKIIIAGNSTNSVYQVKSRIARLHEDGSVDATFNAPTNLGGKIYHIFIQPDGKIIFVGDFSMIDSGKWFNKIIRLNSDGSADHSFNREVYGLNSGIQTAAILPDGKIIVGGGFSAYGQNNQFATKGIARLNADASIDTTFKAAVNGLVYSCAVQPDGKILAGGGISSYDGQPVKNIVRINPDGTLDNTFSTTSGSNSTITSIALDHQGKILVGGAFSSYDGFNRSFLARLNENGTLDLDFAPGSSFSMGNYTGLTCLLVKKDGKILIGGNFRTYQNLPAFNLVQLRGQPAYYNTIRGIVYKDTNHDCIRQNSEKTITGTIVKTLPGPYYSYSDIFGGYQVKVDTGMATYSIAQQFNAIESTLHVTKCTPTHSVTLSGAAKDTCCFNFADSTKSCALLNISIQNSLMRRCTKNPTYVNYCNYGNNSASNVQIKIEYPPYVTPLKSVPMWSSKTGSTIVYNAGTLNAGECKTILITDSVICGIESIQGLTQCIKAVISPASDCMVPNGWDRSSIKVTGNCVNDSVRFIVINEGAGDMNANRSYRIFVNDTLIYSGNYKLKNGETFTVTYPAGGNTIRMEADQDALYTGKSMPRLSIEGCGSGMAGPNVQGLVTTTAQDDLNEEKAIACNIIRDSHDPNDKQAVPSGVGITKQIMPGEELEYVIRFQNTGTDVAYTVKIVDTLDTALDIASFTKGTSSHPYVLGVSGKGVAVLTYTFNNINLPDSTTDKLKSQGLVSFRIKVPLNATLGNVIKNKAYIYFDYNSPVITNETMHTVNNKVEEDLTKADNIKLTSIRAKPTVVVNASLTLCAPAMADLTAPGIVDGSTPALTYYYFNNPQATNPQPNPNSITSSGLYYIVGVDDFGSSDTNSVSINIGQKPVVLTTDPNPVDYPSSVSLVSPSITAGSSPGLTYTYYFNPDATDLISTPNAISSSGIYYIVGKSVLGCTDTSTVNVTIHLMSEVKNNSTAESICFYPNPTSDFLTIDFPTSGLKRVLNIYSSTGALVKTLSLSTLQSQQVNLNPMEQGVYHFEIWQQEERIAQGTLEIK